MTSQMRTRTVAPHQFQPRRRSLGQELRLIANRSGEPSAGIPLSPVTDKKRPASVDNSQLDKCPRSLNDLCSSPQKTPNLPKHTVETNKRRSVPNKTGSLFLRRMTSDGGLENIQLPGGELKPYDLLAQALSPLVAMSPGSITKARILTAHKTMAGVPGLECQSNRRMNTNSPVPKYTTTRTDLLHPVVTNQPIPVRLSVSPVAFRDQTFNAFGGRAGFSPTTPKLMPTSAADPARCQPVPGNLSHSPKLSPTPQNIPTATQFFPTFGSYLPTTGTAPGYYFPILNGTSGAYYSHLGNPVGSLYQGPLSNCRQYHQVFGANGNSLGSYYTPSNEGLMQAGTYAGSLVSNNLSPVLPTQNNQIYYPVPLINSNNYQQHLTAPSPNMYPQNPSDQTSWSYFNRMASPNQIVVRRYSQGAIDLNAIPSGDSIQCLQAEGASLSPSRLGPLVYQTMPIENNGVLYPVSTGQPRYQTNGEVLNVMSQSDPLSSKPGNGGQILSFLSNMRPSPRKKMAALVSHNTTRPGINQTENQWVSNSLSHWQRPLH